MRAGLAELDRNISGRLLNNEIIEQRYMSKKSRRNLDIQRKSNIGNADGGIRSRLSQRFQVHLNQIIE